MKTTSQQRRLTFMSLFLASVISMSGAVSNVAHAQYEFDDYDDAIGVDDTLNMEDINIDGKLSPSELLKRRRAKLEERNRLMMEKKVEDIRVKQEIELTNKLQSAFDKNLNSLNEDKVEVKQAAPMVEAVIPAAPVIETRIVEVPAPVIVETKKSKIIPSLGVSNVKGDKLDLESNLSFNIQGETMVTPQIAVGLSLGYTTMDMKDVANSYVNSGYGGYYNPYYYGAYGQGRDIKSKKITVEANGKFFFTEDSRFKPYVGAGLGYNKTSLKYEGSGSYYDNVYGINYGTEGYNSSSVAGTARLGAEFDINKNIGLNVDLAYSKSLSTGMSKSSDTTNSNPDQGRLENLSKEIENADVTSIQAGLVVRF